MYIIITTRNLLWMMLSVCAVLATIGGILTPKWLLGFPEYQKLNTTQHVAFDPSLSYRPSYGIYNRCLQLSIRLGEKKDEKCIKFMYEFSDLPPAWGACLVFLSIGTTILGVVVVMSLVGFCLQSIGRKSIFSIGGLMQAIAGLFLIIGMVLYPAGWGTKRVKDHCALPFEKAGPFIINQCSLGYAFYSVLGGTLVAFVCAILSAQAEKSTSSDKVQDEISDGKTIICLV